MCWCIPQLELRVECNSDTKFRTLQCIQINVGKQTILHSELAMEDFRTETLDCMQCPWCVYCSPKRDTLPTPLLLNTA